MIKDKLILIRGAGDLATGVAYRLYKSGFKIVMAEVEKPLTVRRTVAFSEAIYQGYCEVEGIKAYRAEGLQEVKDILAEGNIPVIIDPQAEIKDKMDFSVLIDAIIAKRNLGTAIDDAEVVIALGPGFEAGVDVDAVIETNRGHFLGRVIRAGRAQENTGLPGMIAGYSRERVLKAPIIGRFTSRYSIGDMIEAGGVFGYIDQQPIKAEISGVIRGILRSDIMVKIGTKLGDIDPRGEIKHSTTISDKALAIGGGVLEAILSLS